MTTWLRPGDVPTSLWRELISMPGHTGDRWTNVRAPGGVLDRDSFLEWVRQAVFGR